MENRFTMIEILVVVTMRMILLTLLLPAFNNARQREDALACMGNLKSLGAFSVSYRGDYNEWCFMNEPTFGAGSKAYANYLWQVGEIPQNDGVYRSGIIYLKPMYACVSMIKRGYVEMYNGKVRYSNFYGLLTDRRRVQKYFIKLLILPIDNIVSSC